MQRPSLDVSNSSLLLNTEVCMFACLFYFIILTLVELKEKLVKLVQKLVIMDNGRLSVPNENVILDIYSLWL